MFYVNYHSFPDNKINVSTWLMFIFWLYFTVTLPRRYLDLQNELLTHTHHVVRWWASSCVSAQDSHVALSWR